MKKEIADAWVAALRSGKFNQGKFALRALNKEGKEGYCCLGVLCQLYLKVEGEGRWEPPQRIDDSNSREYPVKNTHEFPFRLNNNTSVALLPEEVTDWSGMEHFLGRFSKPAQFFEGTELNSLSDLNDAGADFEYIANFIEKNWERL